jgi:NADPH:quinone reductase-like Zn-dependent oxidoreductase
MKAIYFDRYGPPSVLQLRDMPTPRPKPSEVLVKVRASPVNYGDISARAFSTIRFSEFNMPSFLLVFARLAFGLTKPRITVLGNQFSGEIEQAGEAVTRFKAGDQVFGYTGMRMGAHAEYLCMPADGLIGIKPGGMSHEQACAVPYGIMAVQLLSRLQIKPGDTAFVHGGSGGIGAVAVQIFKSEGAHVTATSSAGGLEYLSKLGADRAIDYAKREYLSAGESYDFILDVLGKLTWSDARRMLRTRGICVSASFKTGKLIQMALSRLGGGKRLICALASEKTENLELLRRMAEDGRIKTIIDRVFPLEEAVAAHEYYERRRSRGQVILSLS